MSKGDNDYYTVHRFVANKGDITAAVALLG